MIKSEITSREPGTARPRLAAFRDDEHGGYMIWSLLWFLVYCGIGGLAVDISDAYRNQTVLQSTADAAALAAAMSLPDQADVESEALLYSGNNMEPGVHGTVLTQSDVQFGTWDFAARTFTQGSISPNAVRVVTRRSDDNANPVAMTVLGIIALFGADPRWNIATEAVAVRTLSECANDGFIAMNRVDVNGNNDLLNNICLHGQNAGVDLQNHNMFEPGVQVSMPDLGMLPDRSNLFDMNPGLADALREGDMWPKDVELLGAYVSELRTLDGGYNPKWPFMYRPDGNGSYLMPAKVTANSLPGTVQPFTVYDISCNGQLSLGQGLVLSNVVIIADCRIHAAADLSAGDVVLASTYSGNNAAIQMAAQAQLGLDDGCAPGGGVELYATGDIHIAAQGDYNGLRIVAGNDVAFTANNTGIQGISVQAGNDIDFTSSNEFGLCSGGVPGPFAWHYRLVQ